MPFFNCRMQLQLCPILLLPFQLLRKVEPWGLLPSSWKIQELEWGKSKLYNWGWLQIWLLLYLVVFRNIWYRIKNMLKVRWESVTTYLYWHACMKGCGHKLCFHIKVYMHICVNLKSFKCSYSCIVMHMNRSRLIKTKKISQLIVLADHKDSICFYSCETMIIFSFVHLSKLKIQFTKNVLTFSW